MQKHLPIIIALFFVIAFGVVLYTQQPKVESAKEHVENLEPLPDLDPKTLKPMEID